MPKLSNETVQEYISKGKISAISLDTAVFDRFKGDLSSLMLIKLDQFKKGGVQLLLSEIVVMEITKHIYQASLQAQRNLRSAIREHTKRWKPDGDLNLVKSILNLDADANIAAHSQVNGFLDRIGAIVIPIRDTVDLAEKVIDRYFNIKAPFEDRIDKKNEFPDAFALLSLEQKAMDIKTLILCISPDKGWIKFAEISEHLIVVPDIKLVLSWFNDHGGIVAARAFSMWIRNSAPNLDDAIEEAFDYYLDGLQFGIEADAPLSFDAEPIGAVLQHIVKDRAEEPAIIAQDEETVTFTIKSTAVIAFEAEFSFYLYDSIDGDDVTIGTKVYSVKDSLDFEITVLIGRDFENNCFENVEMNISPRKITVDFGYVEPFPDEDPTFEKY